MANREHLNILKQGVKVWNNWRKEHPDPFLSPDLTNAPLSDAFLVGFNLYRTNLNRAHLARANLTEAILVNAFFIEAELRDATLTNTRLTAAELSRANLREAKLIGTDLKKANLINAMLNGADLSGANLNRASLIGTKFTDANFDNVSISEAELGDTIFGNVNLSTVVGLEKVWHHFPSIVSSTTMQLSQGKIPIGFMRGCGLTDWEIALAKLYTPDLENNEINQALYEVYDMRVKQAIQISPVFISYSHADSIFVDKLSGYLNDKGIRFWRDLHHATAGRLEKQIDRAMRLNPTVLLILSEHSLKSDWVEHEVRTARGLEKELGHDMLCPIALDESWKASRWSQRIMEQIKEYNILDFSNWKNDHQFIANFHKLIQGLDLFYK